MTLFHVKQSHKRKRQMFHVKHLSFLKVTLYKQRRLYYNVLYNVRDFVFIQNKLIGDKNEQNNCCHKPKRRRR